jgi:hypothetical protein
MTTSACLVGSLLVLSSRRRRRAPVLGGRPRRAALWGGMTWTSHQRRPKSSQPRIQASQRKSSATLARTEASRERGGGGRIGDSGLAVGHIPKDMPMVDRHGWGGFSAKATLHTSNGELGEDMGSGAAPKEIALDSTVKVGPMDTLGGFEGALPSVGSVRG